MDTLCHRLVALMVLLIGTGCRLSAQEASPSAVLPEIRIIPEAASPESAVLAIRGKWEREGIASAIRSGFLGIAHSLTERQLGADPSAEEREELLNFRLHIALVRGDLESAGTAYRDLEGAGLRVDPLLSALLAFFEGRPEEAARRLDDLSPDALDAERRSWRHLLQALLLSVEGTMEDVNEAFLLAERTAPTSILRDHFELIRIRESMKGGALDPETISALRESVRSMQGQRGGFEAARLLAVALVRSGQSPAAIEVLNTHLALPGIREFGFRSDFLLLLGMVAGAETTRGQLALRELLREAKGGDNLEMALSLLTQTLGAGYEPAAFLEDLTTWLGAAEPHPMADRLLISKAYLLMEQGAYTQAEQAALDLLERNASSPFVPAALRLLAFTSWNQSPPRYRTAADYLNQLRQRLPEGPEFRETGILIADCYFLNEDYTSASDAYGAALGEAQEAVAGTVFFQRILSELGANRPEAAARFLDEAYAEGRLEKALVSMAEWNLLDFMRRSGRSEAALARTETLLERLSAEETIPPELILRMEWLASRLTLESGLPEPAFAKARHLRERLFAPPFTILGESLLQAVESHLLLLMGEARLLMGDKQLGLDSFHELRERYPQSGPAILSYLVESRQESQEDNLVNAQQSLIGLVDRFPESEYAPIALWEAALNAEQRGLNVHLREAISILERLVTDYSESGLVYYARLKQGDLARRLNDFPTALLLYEQILSQFPGHPERYRAELSRADCLMALGSDDPARFDAAAVIYERNCLLPTAPLPVRIEAGYKWAHALRQQGDLSGSQGVLWLLYERFVIDPDLSQPILVEEAGRYWMSRVLLDLGGSQVEKGEYASAIRAYETLIRLRLPGSATARARIENLR